MPDYWYDYRKAKEQDEKNRESGKGIEFNAEITASRKPYFMIYVYPKLKQEYNKFIKDNDSDVRRKFFNLGVRSVSELKAIENKNEDAEDFILYFEKGKNVGENPCTINRICHLFENEFPSYSYLKGKSPEFDPTILKSGVKYSKSDYNEIYNLKKEYDKRRTVHMKGMVESNFSNVDPGFTKEDMIRGFIEKASVICPNEKELCDILIDMCYSSEKSKAFVWDIAGDVIISNLLKNNDGIMYYPSKDGTEFEYSGCQFDMKTINLFTGETDDNFE